MEVFPSCWAKEKMDAIREGVVRGEISGEYNLFSFLLESSSTLEYLLMRAGLGDGC